MFVTLVIHTAGSLYSQEDEQSERVDRRHFSLVMSLKTSETDVSRVKGKLESGAVHLFVSSSFS